MPRSPDSSLIQFLVFIVIALLSIVFNWLKKRGGTQEGDTWSAPPPLDRSQPGAPPSEPATPPPRKLDWEAEMRRLLGEEPPVAAPPPPVITPTRPVPLPPAVPTAHVLVPRTSIETIEEEDRGLVVTLPPLTEATRSHDVAAQIEPQMAERLRERGSFAQANAAYLQASRLDVKVAEHMRQVTENIALFSSPLARRPGSKHAARAIALLRDPQTLRSAIVASVILGPPKALEG